MGLLKKIAEGTESLHQKIGEVSEAFAAPELIERLDQIGMDLGEHGVDPFGLDPEYLKNIIGSTAWLYRNYFRVETHGIENIPKGRCLLISNHSGQLPWDAVMITNAIFLECQPPRIVRSMVERFVASTPFMSVFFARCGQILGTPDNCRRLIRAEEAILAFPEGVGGLNKPWSKRYQLQKFGQGFVRLALETNTPIIPVAVIGAEEQAPAIANLSRLGKLLGIPAIPITVPPFFGALPLPSRYSIYFGKPITLVGNANDEDQTIYSHVNYVKRRIQEMLDDGVRNRTSIYW